MSTTAQPRAAVKVAPRTIRLLLVDDHAMVRQGLRSILEREADLEVIGEAADAAGVRAAAREHRPDIALVDIRLGSGSDRGGIALCEQLVAQCPHTDVVMLTTFVDEQLVREAIDRGAKGYVLKDVDVAELTRIVRAVDRGARGFDTQSSAVMQRSTTVATRPRPTARESEVLVLVAGGASNRQIAIRLGISISTVKFHVRNLMDKLDASNRAGMVTIAAQRGLL